MQKEAPSTSNTSNPNSNPTAAKKSADGDESISAWVKKLSKETDPKPMPEPPVREDLEPKPLPVNRPVRTASGTQVNEPEGGKDDDKDKDDLWRGFPANMNKEKGGEALESKDLGDKIEYSWSPGQGQGNEARYVVTKVTDDMRKERARRARPLVISILGMGALVYAYTFYKMTYNPWKEAELEVLAEEEDAELAAFEQQMKMQIQLDEEQRKQQRSEAKI